MGICRNLLWFWKKRIEEKRAYRAGKDAKAGGGRGGRLHTHQIGKQSVERHVRNSKYSQIFKGKGYFHAFWKWKDGFYEFRSWGVYYISVCGGTGGEQKYEWKHEVDVY